MNKKYFLGMFAAAGMLLATSCSNDDLIEQGSGDMATVSFNITTEGAPMSRAISDGSGANILYYRVFDNEGNIIAGQEKKTAAITDKEATVNVSLAKGQTYKIAFWAQKDDTSSPYTVSEDMKVTVDYNGLNNDDARDAFFANIKYHVNGNATEPVTLKRPFAQINVGVTDEDWEAAVASGVTVATSSVKIENAATKLNLIDGSVSDPQNVEYTAAIIPGGSNPLTGEKLKDVAGKDYNYLSMCYVLPNSSPAENSTTVKAEFTFKAARKGDIVLKDGLDNLTIQRNWRTNIVGQLLTGNVKFEVVIDNKFDGDHNYNNGEYSSVPQLVDGNYEVYNAEQWNWLAYNKQEGVSIKLAADIDFNNESVVNMYDGVSIDGNGHALKNLKIVVVANHPTLGDNWAVGLFKDVTSDITVKNLTIDGITVDNLENGGNGFAGALFGAIDNSATVTVDGLTLKNADIKGVQSVGGIVGLLGDKTKLIVKNTTLENNYIHNYDIDGESGFVAGLAGKVVGTLEIGESVKLNDNNIIGIWANKSSRGERSIQEIAATHTETSGTITGSPMTNGNSVQKYKCGTKLVSTAEDLVNFANDVNKKGNGYSGKTVVLLSDIDLNSINWAPIGQTGATTFNGTFDGNNKVIKNLNVKVTKGNATDAAGLFGWNQGTIKNVIIDNATVLGDVYVGAVVGYNEFGSVENCTVKNSDIEAIHINDNACGDKAGSVVGFQGISAKILKNCHAENGTVKAARDAGQIVGIQYTSSNNIDVSSCSATNVVVSANSNCTHKDFGKNIRNEIVGRIEN